MLGPILESEHVRLEPPRPDWLPTFVRWFADPAVTRYLLRRYPPSLKQEEEWLETMARSERDIMWAVSLKDNGPVIGVTGFHRIDWQSRHAWIEIVIGEQAEWGKGFAALLLC